LRLPCNRLAQANLLGQLPLLSARARLRPGRIVTAHVNTAQQPAITIAAARHRERNSL
jgi:hypothetical protein